MSLPGKVVVVTGASAGVGRATARAFGRAGARVALLARGADGLKAARQEIEESGGVALDLPCDVADRAEVEEAAAATEAELGPIDVWINDAMVGVFAEFLDVEPDDFDRVIDVILRGYVHGTRAALTRMVSRNQGTIVQVGSALAFRGIPLQSAYCSAKHAVEGFTESVRCELLHRRSGVHLTEVHLPALNTPQFHWVKTPFDRHPQPVPPIYQPEVAARAIVAMAEHPRRHLLVGASTHLTVWANRFAPGLLDAYLARKGCESQLAPWPIEDGRPDNLHEPVPGDHGARGEFGEEAKDASPLLWASTHRGPLLAAAGVLAAAAALRRRQPGRP